MEKISAVYKITNNITGDFYIGSSKDIKSRWAHHKIPSTWNNCPNNPMYLDMKKYGLDKFEFEILEEVEPCSLKETEQQFIETLKPTYNDRNANGLDIERYKEYEKSDKRKKTHRKASNKYYESHKEQRKQYRESHKEQILKQRKQYNNQLCYFNNEVLTLQTLSMRFYRADISHPAQEAKKYLIRSNDD